ncbi:hypothetical protein GCM10023148_46290 [Actinokineospora soli]
MVVTAAGDLTPTDELAWANLVAAVCVARTRAAMVVVDLTGVTAITPGCLAALARADGFCAAQRRDLRVLTRGTDEDVLREAGLHHLVTAAGILHRAVSGPRSG